MYINKYIEYMRDNTYIEFRFKIRIMYNETLIFV